MSDDLKTPDADGKRERGRPVGTTKIAEPRATVSSWLPASLHDKLLKHCSQNGESVSETIRQLLILKL